VLPIYDALFQQPKVQHILCGTSRAPCTRRRLCALDRQGRLRAGDLRSRRHQCRYRTDQRAYDSTPLVCLTGQVPTHLIGNDAFQECDTVGITRPCTSTITS